MTMTATRMGMMTTSTTRKKIQNIYFSKIALFSVTLLVQKSLGDIVIEGTLAVIILAILSGIAAYATYRIMKWQKIFLEKKDVKVSYVLLVVLVLMTLLTLPIPITYSMF